MARNKALDDEMFNCSQEWEAKQVASHYENKQEILDFLKSSCTQGFIHNSTHYQVYKFINDMLGYPIPV